MNEIKSALLQKWKEYVFVPFYKFSKDCFELFKNILKMNWFLAWEIQ